MNAHDIKIAIDAEIPDLDARARDIVCRTCRTFLRLIDQHWPRVGWLGRLLMPKTSRDIEEFRRAVGEFVDLQCGVSPDGAGENEGGGFD